MKSYFVYIMASHNRTIYIGVTNSLVRRVYEHKNGLVDGFSKKYKCHYLVYFEQSNDIAESIAREKRLKKWRRQWKIELIENSNPDWTDLYDSLL